MTNHDAAPVKGDAVNYAAGSTPPLKGPGGSRAEGRALWLYEFRATFRLAWPLIIAQIAQMSLNTTDVVMMGWLGSDFLGAGSLTMAIFHPIFLFGVGTITAVAALVAQAKGARDIKGVRRSVRQGLWVAVLMSCLLVPLTMQTGNFLGWSGQEPHIVALAQTYANAVAWIYPPALAFMVLRAFVSAQGATSVVLWVTVMGFFANIVLNYGLMFGNWGLPRWELYGAGIATVLVDALMMVVLYLYIHNHKQFRRYHILVRLWRPDWARFRDILRIGLPVGFMLLAETGLFAAAAMMMGWLGTYQLAGHAIALQCAALSFMVPLGLSQATTIRVGLAYGRKDAVGIGVAAWTSQGIGTVFALTSCIIFVVFPHQLVALFLDASDPANLKTLAFAASYLWVAALFQLVDAAQVVSAASLRGLNDTKVPMVIGLIGFWVIGIPVGYLFGFSFGFAGVGVWTGLATGLAFVAVVLTCRFAMRERFGLLNHVKHG